MACPAKKNANCLIASYTNGVRSLLWLALESLGGGLDRNAAQQSMKDLSKRAAIAALLRGYVNRLDQAVTLMNEGIHPCL